MPYGPRPPQSQVRTLSSGYTPPGSMAQNRLLPSGEEYFLGNGYLAGSFPDGITTLNGVPVAATVRVHYRPEEGEPGDGELVASTTSGADGTWRIDGLNPALKYDIIGRLDGQNDVIAANVSPKVD